VTITGSGFGAAQNSGYVQIGTLSGTVNSWSDTQIVATVSIGSQNGVVEVDQNGLYSNSTPFTISAPVIQSISPAAVLPGMQMTITGSGFGATVGGGGVYIGGTYGTIVSWSATQVVFTVPSGITPGSLLVFQNGVNSNWVNYTMIPPVLTSISPTAVLPGMQLTLTGSGFGAAAGSGGVYFGGPYGTVVSWSDTQVLVTVPSGIGPGNVLLFQNNVNSNSLAYTVIPPALTSISPTAVLPGMQMTLTGSGFGTTGNGQSGGVYFGYGAYGTVVSWSNTQVVVTVPSVPPGDVLVFQNYVNSNSIAYTIIPPVLTSISPTSVAPGTQMTLTGSGFGATVGGGGVYFGYGAYGTVVSWSDTQVVVTVPNVPSGNVLVFQNSVNSDSIAYTTQ
jgi:hypothetical protein